MEILINGRRHVIADDSTLRQLLDDLDIDLGHVAIAVNQTFVPRQAYVEQHLDDGDRIDVITRIEGG